MNLGTKKIYISLFCERDESNMKKNQTQPVDINGNHFKRTGFVLVLMVGTFLTIINQTLLVTALPKIMSDLDINAINAQWLITAFMLISGIMIPTSAFLLNTITNRTLFFLWQCVVLQ